MPSRAHSARTDAKLAGLAALLVLAALLLAVRGLGEASKAPGKSALPQHRGAALTSLPAAAQGPVSAALGAADPAYRLRMRHGRVYGLNLAQRLRLRFGGDRLLVTAGTARLDLALTGIGHSGALSRLAPAPLGAYGNRLVYRHGTLDEWYANGPQGLEQGFTLSRPPTSGGGALTLRLAVAGNLRGSMDPDRRGITFLGSGGRAQLRYGGLTARDASGRQLPAWLRQQGNELLLNVGAKGARYPLTIDPFIQTAELTTSDGGTNDFSGYSVAVSASGSTVAVGAPQHKVGGNTFQGAVYVFSRPSGGWQAGTQTAELTASDGGGGDLLGSAVAISGDGHTIVAGAPGHAGNQGAVYVFSASGAWQNSTQTAELVGHDTAAGDEFGFSVGVSGPGDTIAVGSPNHAPLHGQPSQGAAYVFVEQSGGWQNASQQNAELTASDANSKAPFDLLGTAVAVSDTGGTVVAGASDHAANGGSDQGAVYVFTVPSGGWQDETQQAELTASDATTLDGLGASVAISGHTIVAGAPDHTVNGQTDQGAVYVYAEPSSGWASNTQTAELTTSDGTEGDLLGYSVAAVSQGATIAAGAPGHNDTNGNKQGAVYLYTMPSGGWQNGNETSKLEAADANPSDELGFGLGASETTMAAGAPFRAVNGNASQGTVYVFGTPTVSLSPGQGAFGSQSVGTTSNPITFTLTNNGSSSLNVPSGGATLTGTDKAQFAISSDGCSGQTVAPGASCSVAVSFAPTAAGTYTIASLQITDNAPDSPQSVPVSGTGVATAPPTTLTLSNLRQSHARWQESASTARRRRGRRRANPVPVGTTFSFTLSGPADVQFTFEHVLVGRQVAGSCIPVNQADARLLPCTKTVTFGTVSMTADQGRSHLAFDGRVGKKKLPPGTYTVLVVAQNLLGQQAGPGQLRFTIVPPAVRPSHRPVHRRS
jgi:hypothetical protein